MGIEIPDADPDRLVRALERYSRCETVVHPGEWPSEGWTSKRGGRVNFVTTMDNISRVMQDLHGSMNILQYGYIITTVRPIKELRDDDTPYAELDDVYRIILEPLGKYLVYAQHGHYSAMNQFIEGKAPVKP